jgi:hypothetical protein
VTGGGDDPAPLIVKVQDQSIVVSMLGTGQVVTFRKSERGPGLLISEYLYDDREGPISRRGFLGLAWREAKHKARQLGWIV